MIYLFFISDNMLEYFDYVKFTEFSFISLINLLKTFIKFIFGRKQSLIT
jgi:hypothetical protein